MNKFLLSELIKFTNYCLPVPLRRLLIISGACLITTPILAATIPVATVSELQSAIAKAKPGDVISVKDGVYNATEDLKISTVATAAKPVTITAQNIGKAEITGAFGFNIVSPAAHIIIKGFKFTHASSKAKTAAGTTFCRFTRNIFETTGAGEYLTIAGSDHQIDYNTFQNKNSMGRFIAIRGTGKQVAERLWIHHNYLYNHVNQGGPNGAEAFQFGLSGFSLSESNSIVEFNIFEKCAGENELLSVKASAVTVRYNTIRDCPAQLTLRHGNKCQVYGNYFVNTPGLRIFGDDHVIHSNYFENCDPAINIGNGGAEVADGAPLTSHDRPDRVLIAFNTLVNNPVNIVQTNRTNGLGSTNITVAYNIIQGGGAAASIVGPSVNPKWMGNIIFNTKGNGDMPVNTYKITDPKLVKDVSGTFHLQKNSPVIGLVKEMLPGITTDMDGQTRKSPLEPGADEISTEPVKAQLLNTKMVGANAEENKLVKKSDKK